MPVDNEIRTEKYWMRLWSAEENRTISAELVIEGKKTAEAHWAEYQHSGTSTAVLKDIKP